MVGAGIAGSVVASRLAENPDWKVLLLEAGPEEPTASLLPAFAMSAVGSELDWKYETQPQNTACLATGGVCKWPRGKAHELPHDAWNVSRKIFEVLRPVNVSTLVYWVVTPCGRMFHKALKPRRPTRILSQRPREFEHVI